MHLTRAQKARLGAFMIAGSVLLFGGIATLAGLRIFENREFYTVRFTESVAGLEIGGSVKYNGLRVGRVHAMRIDPNNPKIVIVMLSLEPETPLYKGTTAIQTTGGLTGIKTIDLQPGDPRLGRIHSGSEIPQGASFEERITGQATQIATKIEMVVNQLLQWTSTENRLRFEKVLDNVDLLSSESAAFLNANQQPFNEALHHFSETGEAITRFANETQTTLKSLEDETSETLKAIRYPISQISEQDISQTVGNANEALRNLNKRLSDAQTGQLITSATNTFNTMNNVFNDVDVSVRSGREDFRVSLNYLRQAAEDIREFSRIIAQDPSILLRGKESKE